jgi:hypothetical protein
LLSARPNCCRSDTFHVVFTMPPAPVELFSPTRFSLTNADFRCGIPAERVARRQRRAACMQAPWCMNKPMPLRLVARRVLHDLDRGWHTEPCHHVQNLA